MNGFPQEFLVVTNGYLRFRLISYDSLRGFDMTSGGFLCYFCGLRFRPLQNEKSSMVSGLTRILIEDRCGSFCCYWTSDFREYSKCLSEIGNQSVLSMGDVLRLLRSGPFLVLPMCFPNESLPMTVCTISTDPRYRLRTYFMVSCSSLTGVPGSVRSLLQSYSQRKNLLLKQCVTFAIFLQFISIVVYLSFVTVVSQVSHLTAVKSNRFLMSHSLLHRPLLRPFCPIKSIFPRSYDSHEPELGGPLYIRPSSLDIDSLYSTVDLNLVLIGLRFIDLL